jgi:nitroreductase
MEFAQTLERRRMVRNYAPEPVAMECLERIAEAALRAPSAGYSQGVAVVIVTESEVRTAIAGLAEEEEYVASGFDPWISTAPAHLILTVSEKAYRDRYREPDKLDANGQEIEWPIPYWWVDAGASLMAVLLAAVDEGLGAGFLGVHAVPDLARLLNLPPDQQPIGVVTVGNPLPDRRSSSLDRGPRQRTATIHYQHWGGTGA